MIYGFHNLSVQYQKIIEASLTSSVLDNYKKNSAVEIMTGGLVPKPFDSIIPVEQVKYFPSKKKSTHIVVDQEIKKSSYIRFSGEDYNLKDVVVKSGELIQPKHIMELRL